MNEVNLIRDHAMTANLDLSMLDRFPAHLGAYDGGAGLTSNETLFASFALAKGIPMESVPDLRILAASEVKGALAAQQAQMEKEQAVRKSQKESLMSQEEKALSKKKEVNEETFQVPSYSLRRPEMALYTCLDRNSEPGMYMKFHHYVNV